MRRLVAVSVCALLVMLPSIVEARPPRYRAPGGDVQMTISIREQLVVLAVFNGINPQATSYEKLRAMMTLDQALDLDEGRAWIKANPRGNIFAAPDEPKPKALTRAEAEALVDALDIKPTKEHPIDLATGRIIVDVREATRDALAALTKGKTK